jgi:hypothetical protein
VAEAAEPEYTRTAENISTPRARAKTTKSPPFMPSPAKILGRDLMPVLMSVIMGMFVIVPMGMPVFMIMAVGMDVAVGKLLGFRLPNGLYGNIEAEIHARQGMVSVYGNPLVVNPGYRYHPAAFRGVGLELHPFLNRFNVVKAGQGYVHDKFFIPFTVGVPGGNDDGNLVSRLFAFQSLFQAGDNTMMPVKVLQRLCAGGRINHLFVIVHEGVINSDYAIFFYFHGNLYHKPRPCSTIHILFSNFTFSAKQGKRP